MTAQDTNTYKRLIAIGLALSAEKQIDKLMERILHEAKDMVNADAGTIYIRSPTNKLVFEILLNDTLGIALGGQSGGKIDLPPVEMLLPDGRPNNKNIASRAAITGQTIVIADAYETDEFDFSGTKEFDRVTGYRTRSVLTVPLKNHDEDVIGILQLLNAKNPQTDEVEPFSADAKPLIEALSSQASVALENAHLLQEQEELKRELERKVDERTLELKNTLEKLSQAHDLLKELNTLDAVTGIKNRKFFDESFELEWKRAIREHYPISLLILDIDHFKRVNDTFGHLAGDISLRSVAEEVGSDLKRPADILARYGGEEFVVILPHTYNPNAFLLAEKIRKHIEKLSIVADGNEISVTVSIGVATRMPHSTDVARELIQIADEALYEAKSIGRNRVCNRSM